MVWRCYHQVDSPTSKIILMHMFVFQVESPRFVIIQDYWSLENDEQRNIVVDYVNSGVCMCACSICIRTYKKTMAISLNRNMHCCSESKD